MKILKKLRGEQNLTQAALAKELQISPSTIAMYERGERKPDPDMLIKISKYFNVSTDYLLGEVLHKKEPVTQKRPKELIKLIEQEEYTLNGQIATQEDREKLAKIIEALYWDAKEKNKRK